jgi:hypothetical protein
MYVDPLSIYREYVQNAVDSLDEAAERGLRVGQSASAIEVSMNQAERSVKIRDSGAGIAKASFAKTLTSIGGSQKRGTTARGFRGVGRLAGLGYCQELIMRSKSADDDQVTAMQWDCKRLKHLLGDPAELTLEQILSEAVTIEHHSSSGFPRHFFEVEMLQIGRHKNDILLNDVAIQRYLSQVAPAPFFPAFTYGTQIEEFLSQHSVGNSYSIAVNGVPVNRPFQNEYQAKPKVSGKFESLEFFEISGLSSTIDAVGWILHSDYLGAIPERFGIHGLRVRAGNIQIGDARILDEIFPQPRFNAWVVGECHVISSKLVPNARRDNFEPNTHYTNLLTNLTPKAKALLKICRIRSAERTRARKEASAQNTGEQKVDWGKAKSFVAKNGARKLSKLHKMHLDKKLRNGGITYSELMQLVAEVSPPKRGTK